MAEVPADCIICFPGWRPRGRRRRPAGCVFMPETSEDSVPIFHPGTTRSSSRRGGGSGPGTRLVLACGLLVSIAARGETAGFPASETFLPATTRVWASAADPQGLRKRFERSALGGLVYEPLMSTFLDGLRQQGKASMDPLRGSLEINAAEVAKVAGGEVALADGGVERLDGAADPPLLGRPRRVVLERDRAGDRAGDQAGAEQHRCQPPHPPSPRATSGDRLRRRTLSGGGHDELGRGTG